MRRDFASAEATKGHENRRTSAIALWKPSAPPLLGVSISLGLTCDGGQPKAFAYKGHCLLGAFLLGNSIRYTARAFSPLHPKKAKAHDAASAFACCKQELLPVVQTVELALVAREHVAVFLVGAGLVGDGAAGLASGLAGSLAFAAAAVLCAFAEVAGFESFNTLHNIVLHNIIFRSLAAAEKFSSIIYYHKARQKSICLPTFCN